jgi:hypothetical protein
MATGRSGAGGVRGGAEAPVPGESNAIAVQLLSLSLFLLLLVFFIVLNAQADRHAGRTHAVLSSLENRYPTFAIHPRLREGHDPVASRSGTVLAADRVEGMGELFASTVAVSKVTVVTPGRLVEVRLPADGLFVPGSARLRTDRYGLIDRVVDSLRRPREGERLEVDALLAIDDSVPSQPPGPVQRAASLARALVTGGAPPESVSVGIERGEAGSARLLFSLRSTDPKPGEGVP